MEIVYASRIPPRPIGGSRSENRQAGISEAKMIQCRNSRKPESRNRVEGNGNGMESNGMDWNRTAWNGMEWNRVHGMEWNGMEWYEIDAKSSQIGTPGPSKSVPEAPGDIKI